MDGASLGPRTRRVYETLRARILSGELAEGTQLPSYVQQAAQFRVSPVTMRQAIKLLEAEGLLASEHGRGTFVRAATARHILVVDDEAGVREILRSMIERPGLEVVESHSPGDAIHVLEIDSDVVLVLTDVRMPSSEDGLEFIREVRRRWRALPVVALTGFPQDLTPLSGSNEWPVLVVPKPFRMRQIEDVLTLVFPGPATPSGITTNAGEASDGEDPHVLVADDDQMVRDALAALISSMGYSVTKVENGAQAVLSLQQERFSHIFMDLRMPGGGIELASEIADRHRSTAVIIVTAFPQDVLASDRLFTMLTKPVRSDSIADALRLRRVAPAEST
jgi:CheY-like chemotaxis protein